MYTKRINSLKQKKQIKANDIEKLIYMTDTDSCFELQNTKCRLLKRIVRQSHLSIKQNSYEFQILLMSNDLEHVIADYNRMTNEDLDYKQKYQLIEEFVNNYNDRYKLSCFFKLADIFICNTYEQFYSKIEEYQNRASNLNTIYEIE